MHVAGVWSHLACADEPDSGATSEQRAVFERALAVAREAGLRPLAHLAASSGILWHPDTHYDLVRAGGTIAAAGVHTEAHFAISPGEAYDKNLTYRAGRAPARHYMERALALGQRAGVARIVSHQLPLEAAREGYRIFDERLEGATKVLLVP